MVQFGGVSSLILLSVAEENSVRAVGAAFVEYALRFDKT